MSRSTKPEARTHRAKKIDELVAVYASRGAQQRRQRFVRRASFAGGLALVVAGTAIVSMSEIRFTTGLAASDAATGSFSLADANQLAREKAQIASKFAELERQIEAVKTQKQALESQQVKIVEQSEALAALLDDVGSQQTDLEKRRQQGSQLDQEIAAIAAAIAAHRRK